MGLQDARTRRRKRSRGQAMAEMAIAVPVFFLVTLAIIEGGAFAFTVSTLENAAQRGGRMAALDPCPPSNPSCTPGRSAETDVKTLIANHASIATVTVLPADITITVNRCTPSPCTVVPFPSRAAGDRLAVRVNYTYRPITALVFSGSAAFAMTAVTEYRVE